MIRHVTTLMCLIAGGSNKMHQGENYQDFLKWRGGGSVFKSFSYDNYINELEGFFKKLAI